GDTLRAERNTAAKSIGEAIKGGAKPDGPEVAALRARSTAIGERLTEIDAELADAEAQVDDLLLRIPNPAEPDIPIGGADARPGSATWERRPHWDVAEALRIIDLPRGAKIAGSGFPVYKGAGSSLPPAVIT